PELSKVEEHLERQRWGCDGKDGTDGAGQPRESFIHSSRVSIDRQQTNARGYGTMTDGEAEGCAWMVHWGSQRTGHGS
ncbi:hypothetical protein CBD41_04905, partial [bacterium TMED181]